MKRSAEEATLDNNGLLRIGSKRVKPSPSAEEKDDSSATSTASVSEDSALQSSPPASEGTRQDRFSSVSSVSEHESASSASSGLSDDSDASEISSESCSEDEIITIGGPNKPDMTRAGIPKGAQDLKARLSALLPRMAESNESLMQGEGNYNIEDVNEGEQHIEMNLGLGVLEERLGSDDEDHASSETSRDFDAEEGLWNEDEDVPVSSGTVKRSAQRRHKDAMSKLKGQDVPLRKACIEDLG